MLTGSNAPEMRQLLIPFALDARGALVWAGKALPEGAYTCPGCSSPLLLRAGHVRQHHFAHRSGFAGHGEGEVHRLAKQHLALLLVDEAANDKPKFPMFEPCVDCHRGLRRTLPRFARVMVEHRVAADRIADVALVSTDGQLVAVIEVRVSHATDPRRAAPPGVPWIEMSAADALDRGSWRVTGASRSLRCADCGVRRRDRAGASLVVARAPQPAVGFLAAESTPSVEPSAGPPADETTIVGLTVITTPSPTPQWRAASVDCRACGVRSRFFEWDGGDPVPPLPRASDAVAQAPPRWMTRCLQCQAPLDTAAPSVTVGS